MRWRLAVFKAPSRCTSNTTSRGKLGRQERRTLSPHSSEISNSLRHACVKATEQPQVSAKNQRRLQKRNQLDRKSTRLNSSHGYISYAVFCLNKHQVLAC